MLAHALGLLLATSPHLAVVVLDDAGQPKPAEAAANALGAALEAPTVPLGAYLKAAGPSCRAEVRCLAAAPELGDAPRFLALALRELPSGQLAAELRLIDRASLLVVDRRAAVVEKGELPGWATGAAARMLKAGSAAAPRSAFPARALRPLPPPAPAEEPGSWTAPPAPPPAPPPPAPAPAAPPPASKISGEDK